MPSLLLFAASSSAYQVKQSKFETILRVSEDHSVPVFVSSYLGYQELYKHLRLFFTSPGDPHHVKLRH